MNPSAVERFGHETGCPKLDRELAVSEQELLRFDGPAVVIPGGQDDLVASERHRPG